MRTALRILSGGFVAVLFLGLVACGTTLEAQQSRFARAVDGLEALVAKKPEMATAIKAKIAEFKAESATIVKAGGEDAKTKLARLNSRVEAYAKQLVPAAVAAVSKAKGKAAASKAAGVASAAPGSAAVKSAAPATAAPPSLGDKLAPKSAAPATAGKLGAASQPPASQPATTAPAASQPAKPGPAKPAAGSQPAGSQPAGAK